MEVVFMVVFFIVVFLVDMGEDIVGDGADGGQSLSVFVADLDTEFFFERHEGLEDVEGVEAEVVGEVGFGLEGRLVHTQLLMEDGFYLSHNLRLVNHRVHMQLFESLF